jgi:RimJ/RimL family protein N-acetyltransferase
MKLQTKNLILVLRSTDEVLAWIDSLDAATQAEVSPIWLARVKASTSPDPWAHGFVMTHRDRGEAVGSCAYKGPPDPEGIVEIAYGVDPEHRGKGYATEAAQALVDHAFGSGQVRLVRAHTRLDGEASMKVLTRCGFERTGQVVDPEDGLVWRWEIRDEAATDLVTDPKHRDVLEELIAREPIFHRPELGTTRSDFEMMTEADFWEVGASGRRYSRQYVIDALERRFAEPHDDPWETREFQCREIAPDNYLLTYTLIQGARVTRRSTIWRRHGAAWKIVYHQGTIVEDAR